MQSTDDSHADTQYPSAQTCIFPGAILAQSLVSRHLGVGFAPEDPPQP
jgi:hypothetical protein